MAEPQKPGAEEIVGRLRGRGWVAVLTRAGWRCSDATVRSYLRLYLPGVFADWQKPGRIPLPWGVEELQAAGRALKARVVLSEASRRAMQESRGRIC